MFQRVSYSNSVVDAAGGGLVKSQSPSFPIFSYPTQQQKKHTHKKDERVVVGDEKIRKKIIPLLWCMSKAQRDPFRAIKSTKEDGNKLPFPVAIALTDLFYLFFIFKMTQRSNDL